MTRQPLRADTLRHVPSPSYAADPPELRAVVPRRCGQSCRWGGTGGRSGTPQRRAAHPTDRK
ncbi:hypothetical protein, partial [Streptomyces olivaceus]|uniref:hypothetical protein n=1 Tax=Streptomyces olivaceus TaxID=47716 RepID=UPI0033E60139